MQITAINSAYSGAQQYSKGHQATTKKSLPPQPVVNGDVPFKPVFTSPPLINADTEYAINQIVEALNNAPEAAPVSISLNADGTTDYVSLEQLIAAASQPYVRAAKAYQAQLLNVTS